MNKFGTSCVRFQRSTTDDFGSFPMRGSDVVNRGTRPKRFRMMRRQHLGLLSSGSRTHFEKIFKHGLLVLTQLKVKAHTWNVGVIFQLVVHFNPVFVIRKTFTLHQDGDSAGYYSRLFFFQACPKPGMFRPTKVVSGIPPAG